MALLLTLARPEKPGATPFGGCAGVARLGGIVSYSTSTLNAEPGSGPRREMCVTCSLLLGQLGLARDPFDSTHVYVLEHVLD